MQRTILIVVCALAIALSSASANWMQNGNPICAAVGWQRYPMIVSDGSGGAIVTWLDHRSGNVDIYAQRVNASGVVEWADDGVAICAATVMDYAPLISSDGSGGAIIAWVDFRNGNWDIYAQKVNASGAAQWTANGIAICTEASSQRYPGIISDGAGGAIIAWEDYSNNLYAQRVNASGAVQWTINGVPICTAAGAQVRLAATSDGSGGAIIAWADFRHNDFYNEDIYAQRVNASGVVQWTTNGVAICTATGHQHSARITSDGAGGAIVAWVDNRNGPSDDIYAQRINASGAVQWTIDGIAICTAPAHQHSLVIISSGISGAIISWNDERNFSTSARDIYAQRVDASGAVQWTTDGIAICTATGYQDLPEIASDGADGAIVTWFDCRGASNDMYGIYAQKVNASGVVEWAVDGVAACASTAAWYEQFPMITSDGASGAIVTWTDIRKGKDLYDIYAQKVATGFQPVATLLQCYSSSVSQQGITIAWTLAEMDAAIDFLMFRTAQGTSEFSQLTAIDLVRSGLSFAFVDNDIEAGQTYTYRIDIRLENEHRTLFETGPIEVPFAPMTLYQNHPNPFNPSTVIRYYLSERCLARLEIFDVSGKRIIGLVNTYKDKGTHLAEWNGKDSHGNSVVSGIYFCRLKAGSFTETKKIVLLR